MEGLRRFVSSLLILQFHVACCAALNLLQQTLVPSAWAADVQVRALASVVQGQLGCVCVCVAGGGLLGDVLM